MKMLLNSLAGRKLAGPFDFLLCSAVLALKNLAGFSAITTVKFAVVLWTLKSTSLKEGTIFHSTKVSLLCADRLRAGVPDGAGHACHDGAIAGTGRSGIRRVPATAQSRQFATKRLAIRDSLRQNAYGNSS